jgi:SRSO17 transposase
VGVPRILKVYPVDVVMLAPQPSGRGRPRLRAEPDQTSQPAETVLAQADWQEVSWRSGTKGPLSARFAALRMRVADGPAQQIGGRPAQHLPGEEAWLVGESRASGERKYYLSNLPANASLRQLAAAIKSRWSCEQAHQQMKEELGLDHFEGRSWTGLHRHALLTMIAFAFLQHQRLEQVRRGKKRPLAPASAEPARRPERHRRSPQATAPARQMPALPTMDQAAV